MSSPNAPRIIVGIDFSPEADDALAHALAIARRTGAGLVLLHACSIPDLAPLGERAGTAVAEYRGKLASALAADRARLEELRSRVDGQGVEVSHVVVDDFPDAAMVDAAAELDVQMVALGSHGRTGLRWLALGSVARRVVRLARTDVLVGRGRPSAGGYGRICVATDFSASAERALARAVALARPGARIDLVHFWSLPPIDATLAGAMPLSQGALDDLGRSLRAAGDALVAAHQRPGIDLAFEAICAPPVAGLAQRLVDREPDLVVLGSHGRRGVRRFVLGSVAEATVARAPCSALVVRGDDPAR